MAFIIIYCTHASEEEAKRLSKALLERRLIACANIFPMQSMYWWQDAIEEGREWVSILKTVESRWEEVRQAIEETHPYEVPCIMKIEVSANTAYEQWIEQEVA
jgi:periplasmic divalent cation tolerance protein